jgi:hypothetical protein
MDARNSDKFCRACISAHSRAISMLHGISIFSAFPVGSSNPEMCQESEIEGHQFLSKSKDPFEEFDCSGGPLLSECQIGMHEI